MSLRLQLLLVALFTLVLPWAGCRYVKEMEGALRRGQQDALLSSTRTIAAGLTARDELLYAWPARRDAAERNVLYAHPLGQPIDLDGFSDDWGRISSYLDSYPLDERFSTRVVAGMDPRQLYLFFSVEDDDVRYRRDASRTSYPDRPEVEAGEQPPYDRIVIVLEELSGELSQFEVSTAAPGPVLARRTDEPNKNDARIRGEWQETPTGYNVELRMPASLPGPRLGFAVIDADDDSLRWVGNIDSLRFPRPPFLVYPERALARHLTNLTQEGIRLRVVDRDGWILSTVGTLRLNEPQTSSNALLHRIYRAILGEGRPKESEPRHTPGRLTDEYVIAALDGTSGTVWYRPAGDDAVISTAYPIFDSTDTVMGAVVLDRASDAVLTLTNTALSRLISFTLLATVVVAAGLLGYATWLSFRVRKLRDLAEGAIAKDGSIRAEIPVSRSSDELGDLSRSFAGLLGRLREYNEYLRTLAAKLSHELKTPLAVVRSSLENLENEPLDVSSRIYAHRALDGSERLGTILTAMSESNRVEQAIETAEREKFDLAELVRNMAGAYGDVFPERQFASEVPHAPCLFDGVPDLIGQMLDKLVDNAVDFSPPESQIRIGLESDEDGYLLSVRNQGAPLPETMRLQLFDPMVSIRRHKSDAPHLGLGLFIVRLIVAYHGGTIEGRNTENGVKFDVHLGHNAGKENDA